MLLFLSKTGLLSPKQFGFRQKISTEDALLDFCSFIQKSLDNKFICGSLFVDITKAFDMVDHAILLNKLYSAGFRGTIFEWFASYLKNRTQRVRIGNTLSSPLIIKFGVPQGSVLGPVLFLIYINSIFSLDLKGRVTAFADDLGISYSQKTTFDLVCDINCDIALLRKWFAKHKLIISSKTKLMFYNRNEQNCDPEFFYHDPCCQRFKISSNGNFKYYCDIACNANCFMIEIVRQFKYLGVIVDSKLNWQEQTLSLKSYLRSVSRKFFNLSKICTPAVLKMFYFGLFQSKLSYGLSCWGGSYQNKIKPILSIQKSVIRRLCNVHRLAHSFELFKLHKILPVRHLYYFKVLKLFF